MELDIPVLKGCGEGLVVSKGIPWRLLLISPRFRVHAACFRPNPWQIRRGNATCNMVTWNGT
ncbi:hypothetical protein SLEP1_g38106 [Rubroshorea leprosula]|uniref:Uncharacterized protein n=1 Tax=Rubroshorea leprosula TaxID=152421 RepID=A0AAV5KX84_9ROSI|nr:hypothetical protein SLEP1_g38106 [Rubroshorea leprosula]